MESLQIEQTSLTPEVNFDPKEGVFEISGYSRPEDVREFYTPIIKWLESYEKSISGAKLQEEYNTKNLIFRFRFNYFNSASTKFICDMLFQILKLKRIGPGVDIDWYYEEYDDDMRETGEDLSDMINYPFNFYSFKKENEN